MVVMAMLLSLSVVAGCGGGDKKAELIKGLKTEIGTLLGNVDKLAADECWAMWISWLPMN